MHEVNVGKSIRVEMTRSRHRAIALAAGTSLLTAALVYAYALEPRRIVVDHVSVQVRDLHAGLHGFSVVQLSDIHSGTRKGWAAQLLRAVAIANDLCPDLVVLTGDFSNRTSLVPDCIAILAGLKARHGTIAVLGNHDYAGSPRRLPVVVDALREAGITLLRNDVFEVPGGGQLRFVGLDDASTGHDKLALALGRLPCQRGTRIMLSHYPDSVDMLSPGTVDLVLSGHAHGGQVRLPLVGFLAGRLRARTAYLRGRYRVDGTSLYVNRGLGTSFPGIRFLVPPEITHITLERKPEPARRPRVRRSHSG